MIRHFKLLEGIGTFDSDDSGSSLNLSRLVLIYAENGSGKTTIAGILRSLKTGDSRPIMERRRLGSSKPPHVVLDRNGGAHDLVFEDGDWNHALPQIRIFDDTFVDQHVYSGLHVEPEHRQKLHELILGEKGVALNDRATELASKVAKHNETIREKEAAIPSHLLCGMPIVEFCALPPLPDVEDKLIDGQTRLAAAEQLDSVLAAELLPLLSLPALDEQRIQDLLAAEIGAMAATAEERVKEHFAQLSEGGEAWIQKGVRYLGLSNSRCPFCGQDLTSSALISHYSAYFNDEYSHHKQEVTHTIAHVRGVHSQGAQADFEKVVGQLRIGMTYWRKFIPLPEIGLDTESIRKDWMSAVDAVAELLEAKQSAPLEPMAISGEAQVAIFAFAQRLNAMVQTNATLESTNAKILEFKESTRQASLEDLKREVSRLEATRNRHSPGTSPLCQDYLNEQDAKALTESLRSTAREELDEHRKHAFPAIQDAVNRYLPRFNAGFSISDLVARNISSGTSSTYNFVIEDTPVSVTASSDVAVGPTFENTLSAGDRNTLALAFFFSSLYQDSEIADHIVVIDDPISSLDDHRATATAHEIRLLTQQAGQVIVLSHSKSFLCQIWEQAPKANCVTLQIRREGEASTLTEWDAKEDAQTDHDRSHKALTDFLESGVGTEREIARDIRPHLEGYLRVTCPTEFSAGQSLGSGFIKECRIRIAQANPMLSKDKLEELEAILGYASKFHHDSKNPLQVHSINRTELLSYVKRTLDFVKP